MKMTKKSFAQRAVLLLAFVLMFTCIAATAVMAGDPNPTLVFTFDAEACSVVLEYTGATEPVKMESGVAVDIPYGARVTVTVTPKLGYRVVDILTCGKNSVCIGIFKPGM